MPLPYTTPLLNSATSGKKSSTLVQWLRPEKKFLTNTATSHEYSVTSDHCTISIDLRFTNKKLKKAKASDSYIARLTGTKPDQPRFTIIGNGSWSARANGAAALMRPSTERANEQLDPLQQTHHRPNQPYQAFTP